MPNFNDIEGDPVQGAETMSLLQLSNEDLVDPVKFAKVNDLIAFFKDDPLQRHTISRLLVGKPGIDKVQFLYEWMNHKKEQMSLKEKLKATEQTLTHYER